MTDTRRPINKHQAYHAHIYFDESTIDIAIQIRQGVVDKFGRYVSVGDMILYPVGPHPKCSCQINFTHHIFPQLIPWLDAKRLGLTIFVHGLSGNVLTDHTDYAYWLGKSVELNLSVFRIFK